MPKRREYQPEIWSRFRVSFRSFSYNWSVRNGRVLGESSTYFREASRRFSTGREWDWHAPDACRNMPQSLVFHLLLWLPSLSFDPRLTIVINHEQGWARPCRVTSPAMANSLLPHDPFTLFVQRKVQIPEGADYKDQLERVICPTIQRKYVSIRCNLNNEIQRTYKNKFIQLRTISFLHY